MVALEELEYLIEPGENVVYRGKPDKKCFIYESILNPFLPFAAIWGLIDFWIIYHAATATEGDALYGLLIFFIPFFSIHLLPVWIYLGAALLSGVRHRNTAYIITDKALYVTKGTFSRTAIRKPFTDLTFVSIYRGLFDQFFGVGDIIATTNEVNQDGSKVTIRINSISDFLEVYERIKELRAANDSGIMYK